jgi:hypothetical protein
MGDEREVTGCGDELRRFEDSRTIDVNDERSMRLWSLRLGVPQEQIAEAVREVGPNWMAVALKLEAPQVQRIPPPITPP